MVFFNNFQTLILFSTIGIVQIVDIQVCIPTLDNENATYANRFRFNGRFFVTNLSPFWYFLIQPEMYVFHN